MRDRPSILHVDLDAFFAAVEQRDNPALRGKPVIVGGTGGRGVVATASYEARAFGVHSAMPMSQARHRCPNGIFLSPRFEAYREASQIVQEIFTRFSDVVEPVSMDEAFLDIGGRAATPTAAAIRAEIRSATRLAASVGGGTSKLIAKLASDDAKPDGMMIVLPGNELTYLHPLNVRRLWGVGPATAARLAEIGVTTVAELAERSEEELVSRLGQAHGRHLARLAVAEDDREVVGGREAKSISVERTFEVDVARRVVLGAQLRTLAADLEGRINRAGSAGRTVTLKVRLADFSTLTRSTTLPAPTDDIRVITELAEGLLADVDVTLGVRLLGLGLSGLSTVAQLSFDFDAEPAASSRVGETISHAVGEATILAEEGPWLRVRYVEGPMTGTEMLVPA